MEKWKEGTIKRLFFHVSIRELTENILPSKAKLATEPCSFSSKKLLEIEATDRFFAVHVMVW